jgi:hypothetical protein
MNVIWSYPASYHEEIETKAIRICIVLGVMVLAMLVLAFMHMPFPLLVAGFLVLAPLISFSILRHRKRPVEQ